MMSNSRKNLKFLITNWSNYCNYSVLHNYFDNQTKLFSDLFLPKFLDTLLNRFYNAFTFYVSLNKSI